MKRKMFFMLLVVCVLLIGCSRSGTVTQVSEPVAEAPISVPVPQPAPAPQPIPAPQPAPVPAPDPVQLFDDANLVLGTPRQVIGTSSSAAESAYIRAKADPDKKLWIINSNPWAVQTAEGLVAVDYTGSGKFIIDVDLKNIEGHFGGYPSIIYGRSPWSKAEAAGQSIVLPAQVKQMQKLTCLTDYLLVYNKIGGNIAYDLWLTETELPDNPNGGLEVMVWFWQSKTRPLGLSEIESAKRVVINGVPATKMFKVYEKKKSKEDDWDVVTFVLKDSQEMHSGEIEIDMLDFIQSALRQVSRSDDLYLQDIEFGVEFTAQDQDFHFQLNKFDLKQTLLKP